MTGSMTGYGRAQRSIGGKNISVELKSVNHRYFEFNARTPRGYTFLEEKLKNLVGTKVSRGKVDLFLSINFDEVTESQVKVNSELVKSYMQAASKLSDEANLKNDITINSLLRIPEIFVLEKADIDEEKLWEDVAEVCNEAIGHFSDMRMAEGKKLEADLLLKLKSIEEMVSSIEKISPQTVVDYREKLFAKLNEILQDKSIDEGRIITEAAIFAEKIAVDEETVRLRSHLEQFRDILVEPMPVGRKLDFLTQEINREANTIGSKAQDIGIAKIVVDLKGEIEKIREQIQNLE